MTVPRACGRYLSASLVALVTLSTRPARAIDGEVTSSTAAQYYDLRSPSGETLLTRRRLTTTLGIGALDLLNQEAGVGQERRPDLIFRMRLRYDADYGAGENDANPATPSQLVPGFSRGPVDLMYAYVEGRRLLHGSLGFRIGRQLQTDALGFWAFDGASVKVTTPLYVALETYGGLEVRGGLPFSGAAGRYEADGVSRGDRTGYGSNLYPSFEPANLAPAIGVAIETAGVSFVSARLTYRRVYNTGDATTSPFLAGSNFAGLRTSQERLGYAATATIAKLGAIQAGVAYDFYAEVVSNLYASADLYASRKLTLSLDYDYYRPTFDADSIFNFFAAEPTSDLGARAALTMNANWSASVGAHVRTQSTQTSPHIDGGNNVAAGGSSPLSFYPSNGVSFNEGGTAGIRFKRRDTLVAVRATGNVGDAGDRAGADVSCERTLDGRFLVSGRAGFWQWEDRLRPDRSAENLGYVAGLGYRFSERSVGGVEFEHNVNRLVGHRFRVLFYLNVAAFR